ncbi:MAG: hypothetical protein QM602_04845, partial [Microbacterium sp.]
TTTNPWRPSGDYVCGDTTVPAETLTDQRRASELDTAGSGILAEATPSLPDPAAWIVVEQTAGSLTLLAASDVDPSEADGSPPRDIAALTIVRGSAVDDPESEWIVRLATCTLTRDLDGATILPVEVADDNGPASTELHLFAEDWSCGGRYSAADISVAEADETSDTVEFVVGFGPDESDTALLCLPSQPQLVPVSIALNQPLGDRTVVNAAYASSADVFGAGAGTLPIVAPIAASPDEPAVDEGAVRCRGAVIPGAALDARLSASTLGDRMYRFMELGVDTSAENALVVEDSPQRMRLLRLLDDGTGELYELSRLTVFGGLTPEWELTDSGRCDLVSAG